MDIVFSRIKHGLVLLLALLVVSATSQAVACEFSCAAKMQAVSAAYEAGSDGMSAACRAAMSGASKAQGASIDSDDAGSCGHPSPMTMDKDHAAEPQTASVAAVVVDVLPTAIALKRVAFSAESMRLRASPSKPRLVSLRI